MKQDFCSRRNSIPRKRKGKPTNRSMPMLVLKRLESAVYVAFQHLFGDGTTAEDHGI